MSKLTCHDQRQCGVLCCWCGVLHYRCGVLYRRYGALCYRHGSVFGGRRGTVSSGASSRSGMMNVWQRCEVVIVTGTPTPCESSHPLVSDTEYTAAAGNEYTVRG